MSGVKSWDCEYVNLKDGSEATIYYLSKSDASELPQNIHDQLQTLFNDVVEEGRTYPYTELADTKEKFDTIWLANHFAILVKGKDRFDGQGVEVLGTYRVQPNYLGRCSHVSNGAFLVSPKARGQGVGKVLGSSYIRWAPQLGFESSVFNLVFETNVASWRLWDSLGFTRLGVVPGAAHLKGIEKPVDAFIYGMSFK